MVLVGTLHPFRTQLGGLVPVTKVEGLDPGQFTHWQKPPPERRCQAPRSRPSDLRWFDTSLSIGEHYRTENASTLPDTLGCQVKRTEDVRRPYVNQPLSVLGLNCTVEPNDGSSVTGRVFNTRQRLLDGKLVTVGMISPDCVKNFHTPNHGCLFPLLTVRRAVSKSTRNPVRSISVAEDNGNDA